MQPDYEIVLGRGIGNILFGISKEELCEILGDPDDIHKPDEPEKCNWKTYDYHFIKCSFSFDPDHTDRLVEMSIENEFFHIGNMIRNGMPKQDLLSKETEAILGNAVVEKLESEELLTHELIAFSRVGLQLWLDAGVISTIQISPFYNEDGFPVWPE
jgi:hypothetical protein